MSDSKQPRLRRCQVACRELAFSAVRLQGKHEVRPAIQPPSDIKFALARKSSCDTIIRDASGVCRNFVRGPATDYNRLVNITFLRPAFLVAQL